MTPASARPFTLALPVLVALLLSSAAGPAPRSTATTAERTLSGPAMLHDIAALSADSMEGRFPGTAGDRRARAYLVRRLREIGFRPGAPGGAWEQPITFEGLAVKGFDRWRFTGASGEESFAWRSEFIGGPGEPEPRVDIANAELVFVGYGIQAPEYRWDDFKGADLKGKVLLVMNNDPDWDPDLFAGKKRLYYGRWDY